MGRLAQRRNDRGKQVEGHCNMPDMERLTDDLACHIGDLYGGDSERRYWEGFAKGKARARIEVAVITAIMVAAFVLVAGRF